MPVTTLTIPTLIQSVEIDGANHYNVRPLFLGHPAATHRRYSEALSMFKGEIKRRFSGLTMSRMHAEQLFWYKFDPGAKLQHCEVEFSTASHFIKGKFSVATFEWRGNVYASLPSVMNFMFIVPKDEAGKVDIQVHTTKVLKKLLRQLEKDQEQEFSAGHYFSPKKETLTVVKQEVSVKEGGFSFEEIDPFGLAARFRTSVSFDGAEEIGKVGKDLCDLHPDTLERAHFLDEQVNRLYHHIFQKENIPVAIVGRQGVGRHALVDEVVWRYLESNAHRSEFWKRSCLWHIDPNRLIAGMSIVGYWEKRFEAILKFVRNPPGRNDFPDKILIDNPVALLHIGKSSQNDLSLHKVLKPYLEKRLVQVVLMATPEEWKIIQESDRSFSDLFEVIRVDEPSVKEAVQIILRKRSSLENENECIITLPAIQQLFTIHRNYLKHRALPGSVLKILVQITAKLRGNTIDAPEIREEFKAFSGLQERIFDDQEKLEKKIIRDTFELELIGQEEALKALTDTAHLIKAKLTDHMRPLASMLFIGPTGVGKTHAAKMLCKYLMGDEGRLLRFDMNEYIEYGALHRLIGDRNNPEGQLTGKVRYQPFSVILLDEIEKAHESVHNLLLQVLDDARLTDSLGRTVDFSNTVIIMTSNLGAKEVSAQLGYVTQNRDNAAVYLKAVEKFFRPELVNRIERIIPFNPLSKAEIQKIARLQIQELLQRDGFVRRTTIVNVSEEALDWVAERGFDANMGGRALKRQIERDLTLLSAEQLIKTTNNAPIVLNIMLGENCLKPEILPLDFDQPNYDNWLPDLPDENYLGRFYQKLIKRIEAIDRVVLDFEHKRKSGGVLDAGKLKANWQFWDFKERVATIKEEVSLKRLRHKERKVHVVPAIPLRLKRGTFIPRRSEATRAKKENLKDRFFQMEALRDIREEYRNLSPQFDSDQTDYLMSYLDVAFLEIFLEGFVEDKTESVILKFESGVTHSGQAEMEWLSGIYQRLFEKLQIQYEVFADGKNLRAEGYNLVNFLRGECGFHLFYLAHRVPLPISLTLTSRGSNLATPALKVIRIYDGMDTLTDLRTGYSNVANLTSDEFKLLLFGGLKS
jgi:ATP-dependent Clp protease ATP-binding subunit ClpC